MDRLGVIGAEVNGAAKPRAKRKPAPAKRATTRRRKALSRSRRAALFAGGCGVSLLAMSVAHLTESIAALTGSSPVLACCLAVGVDLGMLANEFAILAAHGTSAERETTAWASRYIVATIGMSMGLNAHAFAAGAAAGMTWAAVALGVLVPGLIYACGRVAGRLWVCNE